MRRPGPRHTLARFVDNLFDALPEHEPRFELAHDDGRYYDGIGAGKRVYDSRMTYAEMGVRASVEDHSRVDAHSQ